MTPRAGWSSPRTTTRSRSCSTTRPSCRTSRRWSPSTGTVDGDWVIGLDDLARLGDEYLADKPDAVVEHAAAIPPEQLATLIYTSGTTGRPKGVRLQHRSWVYEGEAIAAQDILDETDLQFLWLPMAHSFGKVLLSTQMACGFATAVDGRVDKIIDNLAVVQPTFMGAAPRIFEKAHGRIVTMQAAEGGAKEKIFKKAFEVGLKVDQLKREGKAVPLPLKLQHGVFDKLVFSKIRDRFGGRVRFFISGAAALNRDIAEWFHAAGIVILEGYGLTESSAGSFVNHPDDYRFGTVGPVFAGSEVKLGEGDEIMIKGPGVMDGYHNLPEETEKALTSDGWLHTGDKGSLDADGFLTITGRIKELFKTSGGKYIAPPAIESKFKAICPYASQFLVFGEERNYCVALVTLDPDALAGWAEENGVSGDYTEIVASEKCQADGRRLRRRAEHPAQPLGDHQEVASPRPRPHHRVGRADAVDEGQAHRRRGQQQGAHRLALRLTRGGAVLRPVTPAAQRAHRMPGSNGCRRGDPPTPVLFPLQEDPRCTTTTTTSCTTTTWGSPTTCPGSSSAARWPGAACSALFGGLGAAGLVACAADDTGTRPRQQPRQHGARTAAPVARRRPAAAPRPRSRSPRARSPRRPPAPTRATAPTASTCSPRPASSAATSPRASAPPPASPRACR